VSLAKRRDSPSIAATGLTPAVAAPRTAPGINSFNIAPPNSIGRWPAHDHRSLLKIEVLARPPIQSESRSASAGSASVWLHRSLFILSLLALIGIAGVATLVLSPQAGQQAGEILQAATGWNFSVISPPAPSARLVVQTQKGLKNEPLPSGLSLVDASGGETVTIAGLAPGTDLSIGTSLGGADWQLSASDLDKTFVGSAKDFVGVMDATAILSSASGRILDRQAIRFEWTERKDLSPLLAPGRAADHPDQPPPAPAKPEVAASLTPGEVADPIKPGASSFDLQDTKPNIGAESQPPAFTCYPSAPAVRQDYPDAWPSWTLRAPGHEGTRCWYATTRAAAREHPTELPPKR
jgi:hypothetical protein